MRFAPKTRIAPFAALAAALALTMPSLALAAPPTAAVDLRTAKALFKSAQADEQAGAWESALEKLRRASTARMTPGIRFHIALCEEKTGHLIAALSDYTAAQTAARDTNNREVLALVSAPLLALKLRVPTVRIRLPGNVATDATEVRIDGAVIPSSALEFAVPVEAGEHTLEASAPGEHSFTRRFTSREEETETIAIVFTAQPAPPPVVLAPPVAPLAPVPVVAKDAPQTSHTLAIVATVGAVVLVAGGVGAFAASGSDQSYWDTQCAGKPSPCGNPGPVRTWDAVALGAWIAGAGAATAAIVLWTRPTHSSAPSIGLRATPGAAWLTGSF